MKLLSADKDRYRFHLGRAEKTVLFALLRKYPLIPLAHHRLTRNATAQAPGDQALLDEAMSAQRVECQTRVQRLLASPDRFRARTDHLEITFDREEIEWLLQVLNDIRVGSWIRLGCPEPEEDKPLLSSHPPKRPLVDMELAGHFECRLLEALHGPSE
jgi:hypothetical protein